MKTNILMPWRQIITTNMEHYIRCRPGSVLGFQRVWKNNNSIDWKYEAYNTDMYDLFYKLNGYGIVNTKEAAMKIVDDALVKAGWILLGDDNIHLLSLI